MERFKNIWGIGLLIITFLALLKFMFTDVAIDGIWAVILLIVALNYKR